MDVLTTVWLGKPAWMWLVFLVLVVGLLAFDLGVLGRRRAAKQAQQGPQEIGVGESLRLSAFYILIALLFGAWVWSTLGAESGLAYFTGFAVEKALSCIPATSSPFWACAPCISRSTP